MSINRWMDKESVIQIYNGIILSLLYSSWGSHSKYMGWFAISSFSQLWIFTGRTDAKAEAPVFWSSDVNKRLIEKVPDAGKDWGQKKQRASEDEMAGRHHWCNEHELEQTPRWWGTGKPGMLQSMGLWRVRTTWWPNINNIRCQYLCSLSEWV